MKSADSIWNSFTQVFGKQKPLPEKRDNEIDFILNAAVQLTRNNLRANISSYIEKLFLVSTDESILFEPGSDFKISDSINLSIDTPKEKKHFEVWDAELKKRNHDRNKQIINALLENNSAVISDVIRIEYPKIERLVLNNSGNTDNAKDIFQDGMVIVVENVLFKKIVLTDSFSSYLYGVCRILWLNHLRKEKRDIRMIDYYPAIHSDILFVENEDLLVDEKVYEIIESLGATCKKLLEYYYYRNMNWNEIAEELGYTSAASARNQKYKCVEKIKKQMSTFSV